MKNLSLIITILGILVLFLLFYLPPIPITSPENLTNLTTNQKVIINGQVIQEKLVKNARILILENDLQLTCDCQSYLKKNITALGKINEFPVGKKTIIVLTIKHHA